jgi:hypothetical protein
LQFTNIQVGLTVKNVLKNAMKASLVAVVAMGVTVVAQPDQVKAASFKFRTVPPSSQLDLDGARDLEVAVGDVRSLMVYLDTVADDLEGTEKITDANFEFGWDAAEVEIRGFATAYPSSTSFTNPGAFTLSSLNIMGPAATSTLLGTFTYKVLAGLVNDNISVGNDLKFVSGSLLGTDIGDLTPGLGRGIDLQPKIIPTPALLPGFAAMGLGMLRKKRQAKAAVA